jgi:hypothetical protein
MKPQDELQGPGVQLPLYQITRTTKARKAGSGQTTRATWRPTPMEEASNQTKTAIALAWPGVSKAGSKNSRS